MKIGFVSFPLDKVGGIKTWMDEFQSGFDGTIDKIFITTNTQRKPEFEVVNKKGYGNFDKILDFAKDQWLYELKAELEDYDHLLFHVPCPHLLKNYTDREWIKTFDYIDCSKVTFVIHDAYLEKYYPWIKNVATKKEIRFLSVQTKSYQASKHVPVMNKAFPFPYSKKCDKIDFEKKESLIVDSCNFKGVKHKELIFDPRYQKLFENYKIVEFGDTSGMYHKKFMDSLEGSNLDVEILGWSDKTAIQEQLSKAKFGLDFSRFAHVNNNTDYVALEYADFGAIPVTQFDFCPMMKFAGIDIRYNNFLEYDKEVAISNNKKLEEFAPKKLVPKIMEYVSDDYKKPESWW